MHKLVFYVPIESAEEVKQAVFATGAGRYENYECCAWETIGKGQFKPINGANPTIGALNQVERVDELKVELLCHDKIIQIAIEALKKAHPYEAPAYEAWPVAFCGCD